jgi:hypothetical protein
MSKLITSALIATVLLAGGLQGIANAQPGDLDRTQDERESICKVLQRNCS